MNAKPVNQTANAKINLYLHVTAKRDDGFHNLNSLVVFADIGDRLTISPNPDSQKISFKTSGPYGDDIPNDENNLVVKAARLLADKTNIKTGVDILLEKNLPPSSGIGGGSADAAACLKGLSALWNIGDDYDDLALELGADVPVCVHGKTVFMGGVGDELSAAPQLPPCWLVLANPGVSLSTPDVFAARKGGFSPPAPFDRSPADAMGLAEILSERKNDLYEAALGLAPEIGAVIKALEGLDGALISRMSGSGATCFALFEEKEKADAGAKSIMATHPGWWVTSTNIGQK